MSHQAFEPAKDAPRLTGDTAIQYFLDGVKSVTAQRVGAELELFLVDDQTLKLCAFPQIEAVLQDLAQQFQWTAQKEHGHIIALSRDDSTIALEPGGQLEYASAPAANLAALQAAVDTFRSELQTVTAARGLNGLSLGLHPTAKVAEIPLIPKMRYAVMAPRLETTGRMARYMMRGCCAWQCALDYISETDWQQKFQTAFSVTSLASAIFANGRWEEGKDNGYASKRLEAWLHTDPARCGFIPEVFSGSFGFEDYFAYACRVPMLFIVRDGAWVAINDLTFGDFLRYGYESYYATLEDWILHLSTLFPEVRLKQYIEIRGADANRFDWGSAYPALFVGLFASSALMEAAQDLTRKLSYSERLALHAAIAKEGLLARCGRVPVYELARELVAMACDGLQRQGYKGGAFLTPVATFLQQFQPGKTPVGTPHITRKVLRPYLLIP